jgi:MFS family permease
VLAIPQMSLPVLFDEISAELGLSLVQVGWIWGAGSVLGIFMGLIGGPVGDRFGPRRTLAAACLLMGIAGISRDGFMAITMTAIIEEKGIGPRFAGTATGLNMSVIGIASFFAPPVGNWLAKFGTGLPFLFWAALVFLGFTGYLFMRPTAAGNTGNAQGQN